MTPCNYKNKVCKKCGNTFKPNSSTHIICSICSTKKCVVCGKDIKTYISGKNKYCSTECYFTERWGKHKCLYCGEEARYRFCSKECSTQYDNKMSASRSKKRFWKYKFRLMKELGNKCVSCGNSDIRTLEIDHIDRHKKTHPKNKVYNYTRRMKSWLADKNNLRLLCANCHRIRTWKQMGYNKNA